MQQMEPTLTWSNLKGKARTSTGAVPKKKTLPPVMYKGIEKKVKFSGNQEFGENIARQYMKAVLSFQELEKNLNQIGRGAWTMQQIDEIEEMKQVIDHLRIMPIISEFHLLVVDLLDKEVEETVEEIHQPK